MGKLGKYRFRPTVRVHPENDQLIDIAGDEMKLVHDGPTYAEPHDCIMARRDQIKPKKIWDRNDPFFASTLEREKKDGINLRSEEHTSELQSLLRNSYAVFSLKKNTHYSNTLTTPHLLSANLSTNKN